MPNSVIAGVESDGLVGKLEGTRGSLVVEVKGAEIVHRLLEFRLVGDRYYWVRTVVLRDRSHVRPLRPLAERHRLPFLLRV
uniref:Protein farnesyltransferase alpha subunit n=1 Tax=Rhizophora mucronata TaxID=61149 RepID=A0A2P2JMY9_RHIMU